MRSALAGDVDNDATPAVLDEKASELLSRMNDLHSKSGSMQSLGRAEERSCVTHPEDVDTKHAV